MDRNMFVCRHQPINQATSNNVKININVDMKINVCGDASACYDTFCKVLEPKMTSHEDAIVRLMQEQSSDPKSSQWVRSTLPSFRSVLTSGR